MSWKPKEAFHESDEAAARKPNPSKPAKHEAKEAGEGRPGGEGRTAGGGGVRWRTPAHQLVHRGVGELGQAWGDKRLESSGRPRELVVKVELPGAPIRTPPC
ncbi:MAG: hypothetical protein SGPRY_014808, partial [Prymnesium sp.]